MRAAVFGPMRWTACRSAGRRNGPSTAPLFSDRKDTMRRAVVSPTPGMMVSSHHGAEFGSILNPTDSMDDPTAGPTGECMVAMVPRPPMSSSTPSRPLTRWCCARFKPDGAPPGERLFRRSGCSATGGDSEVSRGSMSDGPMSSLGGVHADLEIPFFLSLLNDDRSLPSSRYAGLGLRSARNRPQLAVGCASSSDRGLQVTVSTNGLLRATE